MAGRGRTPLTTRLRWTLGAHEEATRTGVPVAEVLGGRAEAARQEADRRELTRRDAVRTAGLLAAGGVVAAAAGAPTRAGAAEPDVVVVGAGLAGLRAAHWLWKVKGIAAAVYEGSTRLGGRCWTLRDHFPGYVVEHGGALINTDHNAIRNLARSLGLTLDTVNGGSYAGWVDTYRIDGADYPYDVANADWGQVWLAVKNALKAAPYPQTYDTWTPAGRALDDMTVDEWLDANVPGGLSSRFARLMQSNAVAEYGLDPAEQSALNFVYLLGWNGQNSLSPLNGSDEKYSVRGGNDQLVTRMAAELPAGSVHLGHRLTAVQALADGRVRLSFSTGGGPGLEVTAQRIVLALPFTTLRDVDLSQAGLRPATRQAIAQLDLGANAKLHLGVRRRPWVEQGYGGACYTHLEGFQCGWDDTADQPLPGGVLNLFPGGSQVSDGWSGPAFGVPTASQVQSYLAQVEPIFPGTTAAYTGVAYRDFWHANPWSRGAYTAQRPGQYTRVFGAGSTPEGSIHFAGEHTSTYYYGFLNGAVESGERAAKAVALS
ncbi:NAD(P)/FAD-dependent oxidoreductase [Fodinibacter luteus]|uniref:NAD(P)/FAD-dependent oxidoreductase n=1 Tax=Fodinibacter luteus TaxID=552064 RepID=A0ABP8K1J8_9MICO